MVLGRMFLSCFILKGCFRFLVSRRSSDAERAEKSDAKNSGHVGKSFFRSHFRRKSEERDESDSFAESKRDNKGDKKFRFAFCLRQKIEPSACSNY